MIPIAMMLILLALLLFIFAWRGRVVARGQFCRKCRFDLAGLAWDESGAQCPECGHVVCQASARRALLRRRSRGGLVAALILMLGGIGTLGFWASGNASVILKPMPDWAVVRLTDMGMDAALDELVARVSRAPNPMSAWQMNNVIELGLAHQADTLTAWDPRWGEVLYVALVGGQMSDEQIKQYMLNGVAINMLIRDRVHQGARQVDCQMKITPGRLAALNGGATNLMVRAKWVADGIVGKPSRRYSGSGAMAAQVRVPDRGWWSSGAPYPIKPWGSGFNGEIGSKVRVYTQYDFMIKAIDGQYGMADAVSIKERDEDDGYVKLKRFTVEHDVEIIDPSEPIVRTIDDPELARTAVNALTVSPIKVMKTLPEPQYLSSVPAIMISRQSESLPESIALRVYLRLDGAQEIEIGSWVTQGPHAGLHGSGIQWRVNSEDEDKLLMAQETVDQLIKQGRADVILRTDAAIATGNPEIEQVIGMAMIFEDVPVQIVETLSNMWNSGSDDWIKGELFDADTPTRTDSERP